MTVRQLIDALQKFDPDLDVVIWSGHMIGDDFEKSAFVPALPDQTAVETAGRVELRDGDYA